MSATSHRREIIAIHHHDDARVIAITHAIITVTSATPTVHGYMVLGLGATLPRSNQLRATRPRQAARSMSITTWTPEGSLDIQTLLRVLMSTAIPGNIPTLSAPVFIRWARMVVVRECSCTDLSGVAHAFRDFGMQERIVHRWMVVRKRYPSYLQERTHRRQHLVSNSNHN